MSSRGALHHVLTRLRGCTNPASRCAPRRSRHSAEHQALGESRNASTAVAQIRHMPRPCPTPMRKAARADRWSRLLRDAPRAFGVPDDVWAHRHRPSGHGQDNVPRGSKPQRPSATYRTGCVAPATIIVRGRLRTRKHPRISRLRPFSVFIALDPFALAGQSLSCGFWKFLVSFRAPRKH